MRLYDAIMLLSIASSACAVEPRIDAYAVASPFDDALFHWDARDSATWVLGASTNWFSKGKFGLAPLSRGGGYGGGGTGTVAVVVSSDGLPVLWLHKNSSIGLSATHTMTSTGATFLAVYERPAAGKYSIPLSGTASSPLYQGVDNKHIVQWGNGYRLSAADSTTGRICKIVVLPTTNITDAALYINGSPTSLGPENAYAAGTTVKFVASYANYMDTIGICEIAVWDRALDAGELEWVCALSRSIWRVP